MSSTTHVILPTKTAALTPSRRVRNASSVTFYGRRRQTSEPGRTYSETRYYIIYTVEKRENSLRQSLKLRLYRIFAERRVCARRNPGGPKETADPFVDRIGMKNDAAHDALAGRTTTRSGDVWFQTRNGRRRRRIVAAVRNAAGRTSISGPLGYRGGWPRGSIDTARHDAAAVLPHGGGVSLL